MVKNMLKIKFYENDFKEYFDGIDNDLLSKAIQDNVEYCVDDMLYHDNIEVNNLIDITHIYNYNGDCNYKLKISPDDNLLLSLIVGLDDYFYDCKVELWNTIVLDDDKQVMYNFTTEYDESLYFLISKIEDDIVDDVNVIEDIDFYINDFEYKDLVDKELLKEMIIDGVNKLYDMINNSINEYFDNEFMDLLFEIEINVIDYMYDECRRIGYYECYV